VVPRPPSRPSWELLSSVLSSVDSNLFEGSLFQGTYDSSREGGEARVVGHDVPVVTARASARASQFRA
jgi:hypothetical protein